ncbi:hypothetical protein BDV26DRAFT_243489 [Aspergillus bertholletiae]|uniref:Transmembrane protein n=1 Tax=Aspergillus bertholletiae TaxID=1226010 RepID=A0A5N7B4X2_9EURO|nr:hypothetical protein BDV26DRAFT_243489 [Aspergillus bertholletiae]
MYTAMMNTRKENHKRNTQWEKKPLLINLGRIRNRPETWLNRGMDPSIYWIELPFSSDDSSLQPRTKKKKRKEKRLQGFKIAPLLHDESIDNLIIGTRFFFFLFLFFLFFFLFVQPLFPFQIYQSCSSYAYISDTTSSRLRCMRK